MTLRGRLNRLEQQSGAGGLTCPGCGWNGRIVTVNEYVDAAGRVVRLEDWERNRLPGWPDIPSCDLCYNRVKYIVARCPVAVEGVEAPAGRANHEP